MKNVEEVRLDINKICKHSVRYDASGVEQTKLLRTIYIGNALYERIGKPKAITVTVQPIKKL